MTGWRLCLLLRYPRKKFWLGKPIPHMVKRKTGEFSDKVLSLQRGLREFQGKGLQGVGTGCCALLSELPSQAPWSWVVPGPDDVFSKDRLEGHHCPLSSPGKLLRDLEYKTGECAGQSWI